MKVYFEIGPLKEREYTGIAQVTAALSQEILGDAELDSEFFFGRMIVPKPVVEGLLRTRNGDLLEWYLRRGPALPAPTDPSLSAIAVFPNRKTARRAFTKECQIIHDLSTLLTPQFHNRDTIEFHATSLEHDILSNDATLCVSDATRSDVLAYFPNVDASTVHTMPLAASIVSESEAFCGQKHAEPYVLVLGTIEPRKNASQVLDHIQTHPEFSKSYRTVFLGRFGWGTTIEQLVTRFKLDEEYSTGRIVFGGFVAEHVKNRLIRNAKLVVYPSLFEGFGLPVLEAAALGVPCVTTRSSSLPEVGGSYSYYFDPFTVGDFSRALIEALKDLDERPEIVRRRCLEWSKGFSWPKTYAIMRDGLLGLTSEKG